MQLFSFCTKPQTAASIDTSDNKMLRICFYSRFVEFILIGLQWLPKKDEMKQKNGFNTVLVLPGTFVLSECNNYFLTGWKQYFFVILTYFTSVFFLLWCNVRLNSNMLVFDFNNCVPVKFHFLGVQTNIGWL